MLSLGLSLWRSALSGSARIVGTARLTWTGLNPTITGVTFYTSPAVASMTWTGHAPSAGFDVRASPAVASVTFTGPAPSLTGLLSANAIVWGSGNPITWGSNNELTWGA